MLEHPEEYDWLGTRLEIARKLRTDSNFRAEWLARSAELEKATLRRLEKGRQAGRLRDDVPTDVLLKYLDLVLDGLIARLATGQPTDDLHAVLDLVEESVRAKD